MKLIKDDKVLAEYNEETDKMIITSEFCKADWKKRHYVHLSTFFGRAESDWAGTTVSGMEMPDVRIND